MRDPYDILGVKRGAGFAEIKAAYRKACKTKHPDMGGSHDEFIELQSAYDRILSDLKGGRTQERAETHQQDENARAKAEQPGATQDEATNEAFWRDIDEEINELRRSSDLYERAMRERRAKAWESGDAVGWAKLGIKDIRRFLDGLLRAGAKGILIIAAAIAGVGAIITQFNLISALIILGSGLGLFLATAMKNDKGGVMSAFLLLFGLITIWSPAVRAAVLGQPFATLSALICLGLIFKFIEQRSIVGLLTGGILAVYVLSLIGEDVQKKRVPDPPPQTATAPLPAPTAPTVAPPSGSAPTQPTRQPTPTRPAAPSTASPPQAAPPDEPRIMLAAQGAMLKFVEGIPYQLKVRSGMTTSIVAVSGTVAYFSGDTKIGDCTTQLDIPMQAAAAPYQDVAHVIRACGTDAVFRVEAVR